MFGLWFLLRLSRLQVSSGFRLQPGFHLPGGIKTFRHWFCFHASLSRKNVLSRLSPRFDGGTRSHTSCVHSSDLAPTNQRAGLWWCHQVCWRMRGGYLTPLCSMSLGPTEVLPDLITAAERVGAESEPRAWDGSPHQDLEHTTSLLWDSFRGFSVLLKRLRILTQNNNFLASDDHRLKSFERLSIHTWARCSTSRLIG